MDGLSLLVSIVGRSRLPDLLELLQKRKVESNLISLGRGTAADDVLDMLGMESAEKAICFSVVTGGSWKILKRDLREKLRIDEIGRAHV